MIPQETWSVLIQWLVLFGLLKGIHSDSECEYDSEREANIKMNKMGPVADKTVSVDLEGSFNMVMSMWSVECSILSSIQGRAKSSCINILQLEFLKWLPGGSLCRAEPPGDHFQKCNCKS